MLAENYRQFSDFAEPANNSYSFLFMNLRQAPRLSSMQTTGRRQMVLVADRNPLFDSRGTHRITLNRRTLNSITHENGAGQNAIYIHGAGGWFTSPTIGVDRDNIYQAGNLVRYQGTEEPNSPTDTLLVP